MNRSLLMVLTILLGACARPGGESSAPGASTPPATTTTNAKADAGAAAAPAAAQDAAATAEPATAGEIVTTDGPAFKTVAMIRAAATLPRQPWRLSTATDATGKRIDALLVRPDKPLQLTFQRSGKVAIGNACNAMSAPFTVAGRTVTLGPYATTRKACADPELASLDAEVGARLQGDFGYRMAVDATPALELRSASGDVLVFLGSDAADAKPPR